MKKLRQGISAFCTYGTKDAKVVGDVSQTDPFLEVCLEKGYKGIIATHLVGSYNLPNVLAAVAVGKFFKVADNKIKEAIENYMPSNSRSQLIQKGSAKIILDAYNANPSSMKAAIENFANIKGDRKILALGAMAELGENSMQEHAGIIEEIKKYPWQQVVLVGGDFVKLQHPFQQFSSPQQAGEWLKDKTEDAYILIKGSRSMQMEKVLECL